VKQYDTGKLKPAEMKFMRRSVGCSSLHYRRCEDILKVDSVEKKLAQHNKKG